MRFFTQKNIKSSVADKGFTLVEVIVSVGLFVAVFIAISSSFLSIIGAYKKVSAERVNVDNLGTAVESMVRAIKTGSTYHCGSGGVITDPQDCIGGGTYLSFKATNPSVQITYQFAGGTLQRKCEGGSGCPAVGTGSFYPIAENTSAVQVTDIKFYVFGTTPYDVNGLPGTHDTNQPRVIIVIKGTSGLGPSKSAFSVQTAVTQRLPDIIN